MIIELSLNAKNLIIIKQSIKRLSILGLHQDEI